MYILGVFWMECGLEWGVKAIGIGYTLIAF